MFLRRNPASNPSRPPRHTARRNAADRATAGLLGRADLRAGLHLRASLLDFIGWPFVLDGCLWRPAGLFDPHRDLRAGHELVRCPARAPGGTTDALYRQYPQDFEQRLRRIYTLYTLGFILLVLLLALAEPAGMARSWTGYVFLLVTVSLYARIGIGCRTSDQVEYYVEGSARRPSTPAWRRRPTGCPWRRSSAWRARCT